MVVVDVFSKFVMKTFNMIVCSWSNFVKMVPIYRTQCAVGHPLAVEIAYKIIDFVLFCNDWF
jgi:hypothetical protein